MTTRVEWPASLSFSLSYAVTRFVPLNRHLPSFLPLFTCFSKKMGPDTNDIKNCPIMNPKGILKNDSSLSDLKIL